MSEEIPLGTTVILSNYPGLEGSFKGIKCLPGIFRANEYDSRFHSAGGRGITGYYYYVSDHYLTPYGSNQKKSGFAKFIKRVENS